MLKGKVTPPEQVAEHKQKEAENKIVLNYLTIRKIVGWLGILLPVFIILTSLLLPNCNIIQPSISDYHNTISRDLFVGLLCAISLFLFSYKGYGDLDNWLANITGVLGFVVAFFPTHIKINDCSIYPTLYWNPGTFWPYADWVTTIHLTCAAIFISLLGVYSFFLFTRSDKHSDNRTKEKRMRNRFYRTCAVIIWVSVIILGIYVWKFENNPKYKNSPFILIFEWVALIAFGSSWLIKGETMGLFAFLKDKPEDKDTTLQ